MKILNLIARPKSEIETSLIHMLEEAEIFMPESSLDSRKIRNYFWSIYGLIARAREQNKNAKGKPYVPFVRYEKRWNLLISGLSQEKYLF